MAESTKDIFKYNESVEKVHIVMLNEVKHLAKPKHLDDTEAEILRCALNDINDGF